MVSPFNQRKRLLLLCNGKLPDSFISCRGAIGLSVVVHSVAESHKTVAEMNILYHSIIITSIYIIVAEIPVILDSV